MEGLCPKGNTYKAAFTHVRRKSALYVNIVLTKQEGLPFTYVKLIELKKELNSRAMKGERANVYTVIQAMENFIYTSSHEGYPEAFLRAAWQRTSTDRVTAIYQCFESKPNQQDKDKPEQDLFS